MIGFAGSELSIPQQCSRNKAIGIMIYFVVTSNDGDTAQVGPNYKHLISSNYLCGRIKIENDK